MARKSNKPLTLVDKAELNPEETAVWNQLVRDAYGAMDDSEVERIEKIKHVAQKKLKRMELEWPEIGIGAVLRACMTWRDLIERSDEGTHHGGFNRALKTHGCPKGDFLTALDLIPDVKAVNDYICKRRNQLMSIDNEDMLIKAREAQAKLLTEDDCKLSSKMAMFTLQHLDDKTYGEQEKSRGASEGSAQTIYKLEGITINMLPVNPQKPVGETVDVMPIPLPIGG